MLTTAEVLANLGNWLSPGEISEVLNKILRVPEAWKFIHNPDNLEQILDRDAEVRILPASLIANVNHTSTNAEDSESSEDIDSQWIDFLDYCNRLSIVGRDFEDVADLSLKLQQLLQSPIHPDVTRHFIQSAPFWISPIACAWPKLENGAELLGLLIAEDPEIGLALAINALLANYPKGEAIKLLLDISQELPRHKLIHYLLDQEPKLLEAFKSDEQDQSIRIKSGSQASPDMHLALSILAQKSGLEDLAATHMERATDLNNELRARLKDQQAKIHAMSGEDEAALEAYHQALAIHDSAERRADFSLLHSQLGNADDAIQILSNDIPSLEENIAAASSFLEQGEPDQAKAYAQSAFDQIQKVSFIHFTWTSRLIHLLKELVEVTSAIQVAKIHVSRFPSSEEALIELAILLNDSGDSASAVDYASLAFALSPDSPASRQTLANSLQAAGYPTEALAHWTALADEDPHALSQVALCALQAGLYELAVIMARNFIEHEPQSAAGHVLLGRSLAANNEVDEAFEVLEKTTQEFPDFADAWIALSECQIQKDDPEAAGHTLATAIQLIPDHPELLHAYSIWLERQGRQSEAIEASEKAYQEQSTNYTYQVSYGNLLRELGHQKDALLILKQAVSQKPYHWIGLQAIAKTYEAVQDLPSACQAVSNLPDSIPGDVHLYAAKLSLQLAQETEDPDAILAGRHHLYQAKSKELVDPTLQYLQGLLEELQGNYQHAADHYQLSAKSFIHKDPEYYLASKLGSARTALAVGHISEATSTLEEARLRYPASMSVLTLLSKTYLESGNEIEALKTIERALKIDPSNRFALRQIAEISSQLKTWAPAMHAFKKSVDLEPDNPRAWIDFAENALTVGNIQESRKALSEALQLNRQDPLLLASAAKVLQKMKRSPSARRLLQRALRKNEDSPSLLRQLAEVAEDAGDHDTALQAWERLSEIEPQDKQATHKTAQAFWATNNRSGAIKMWERILKTDATDLHAMEALTNAYVVEGSETDGFGFYLNAIENNPGNIEIALQAARFAMDMQDDDMAFDVLSTILRHAPKNTDVLLVLADCLVRRNQAEKALEVLESVIVEETFPVRWFALVTIASVMMGDFSRAHASFEQACQHTSLDDRDVILFSRAAVTLNRWNEAIEVLVDEQIGNLENPTRLLAEAHVRIRASEINSLYLEAQAFNHAPLASLDESQNLDRIESLLNKASRSPVNQNLLERLSYRNNLLRCQNDPATLLTDLTYAETDKTGEILEAMALFQMRMEQPGEALNLIALRDDFEIDGDLFDIIVGNCHLALNRIELARDVFKVAQDNPLFQPLAQYLESQTLVEDDQMLEKKSLLNAALSTWPGEYAWQYQLGTLYLAQKELDAALPHLQQAAELLPENELYNLTLARVLRDTGHLSQAYARLNLAAKNAPMDHQIIYEAGSLALALGDAEEAQTHFETACSISPTDSACLVGSARAALALGNSKVAMENIRAALRLAPEDTETLIAAGEIFASQGKFDKAISSYELALVNAADPLPVHLAHIKLLSRADRVPEALERTKQFIEQYPEDERIWAAYAEASEAAQDLIGAQEAASKAIQLAPNNIAYRLILGRISRKAGQLDRALDELSRLEKIDPANAKVLIELGHLFEERRQFGDALETYQRAISNDNQSATAYYRAGLVLKNLKSYPEAGEMLSMAAELDPNNPDTHHQLAAVRALELVHGGISQVVSS